MLIGMLSSFLLLETGHIYIYIPLIIRSLWKDRENEDLISEEDILMLVEEWPLVVYPVLFVFHNDKCF